MDTRIHLQLAVLILTLSAGAASGCSQVGRSAEAQGSVIPRTPDGKPDLQGIWQVLNSASVNIQDHSADSDGRAGHGVVEGNELPYLPAAAEQRKKNFQNRRTADPLRKCYLAGVPRLTYLPFPFQIVQTPQHVFLAYEYVHATRMVFMDGSEHYEDIEFWLGDSRGHWEGDTLVADVRNFNDATWFDAVGNFHSNALHVVERYTRTDRDHMNYEATIEDSKVFSRPWKMRMVLYRRTEPNAQLFDYQCYAFEDRVPGLSIPLARQSTKAK